MSDIRVSVIIPVYNTEKYLSQCLDTVLAQTLREIEVICIDDGSTDASVDILKKYAKKDSRVKVLHQQNQYAGAARNRGMEIARGEYLIFLDSDDFFDSTLLEKTYHQAKTVGGADIVLFGGKKFNTKKSEFIDAPYLLREKLLPSEPVFSALDAAENLYKLVTPCPWTKLFRRTYLEENGLQFQYLRNSEDIYFVYLAMSLAKSITYVKEKLVFYRIGRSEQLTNNLDRDPTLFLEGYEAVYEALNRYAIYEKMKHAFTNCILDGCVYHLGASKTTESRFKISEAFLAPAFTKMNLFNHPDDYYDNLSDAIYVRNALNAAKVRREIKESCDFSLVSVIIPVYNSEKYLPVCLDSVLGQTLREIELICVDDGSTDGSSAILAEYAARDSRIKVFHQQNRYAGAARNLGLSKAKGEYLYFFDSDDFCDLTLLEKAYKQAKAVGDADVVLFGGRIYYTVRKFFCSVENYLEHKFLPEGSVFSHMDVPEHYLEITIPCPWTKLFRRAFVEKEQLQFQSLKNSNNVFFVLSALCLAEKVTYVDEKLVFYRREQEISLQDTKDDNPTLFLEAYEAVYRELQRRGIYGELEKSFTNAFLSAAVWNMKTLKTDEARLKICEAMQASPFREMGLMDHPDEYYSNRGDLDKVRGTKDAVEWREKLTRKRIPDFQILKDSRPQSSAPAVSVIIPVYNTAPWLPSCLDSILNQSLKDIEILCVDDGSDDGSRDILLKYAARDARMAVFSERNSGQSAARNRGTEQARGRYIYFMDSDDLLEPEALKELTEQADRDDLELLCFNGGAFADEPAMEDRVGKFHYFRDFSYAEGAVNAGEKLYAQMLRYGEYRCSPCLVLIRRDIILKHNLSFYEGVVHEDEIFTYQLLLSADRVGCNRGAFFRRRIREESTMTRLTSFDDVYGYFICYVQMMKFAGALALPDFVAEQTWKRPKDMLSHARGDYSKLSAGKRQARWGLPADQRQLFQSIVVDFCNLQSKDRQKARESQKLKNQLKAMESSCSDQTQEVKKLKRRLKNIKSSHSYKLGRALLGPARKCRDLLFKARKQEIFFSLIFGIVYSLAVNLIKEENAYLSPLPVIFASAFCYVILYAAELCLDELRFRFRPSAKIYGIKFWVLLWIAGIVMDTLCLCTYFPGVGMNDGLNMLRSGMTMSRQFPVFYCAFITFLAKIGRNLGSLQISIVLYSVLQILVVSAACAFIIFWFFNKSAPKWMKYIVLLYLIGEPLLVMYSVSMLKDTLFSVLLIVLVLLLYDLLIEKKEDFPKWEWAVLVVAEIGIICMRNNGVYIIFPVLTVLLILCARYRKQIFCSLVLCMTMLVLSTAALAYYNQSQLFQELAGVPLQQMAAVAANDGEMTEEQREFINQLMPLDKIKEKYLPSTADPIKWSGSFDRQFLDEHKMRFLITWAQMLPHNFSIYEKAYLQQTFWFWAPCQEGTVQCFYTIETVADNDWLPEFLEESGIHDQPLFPECINLALKKWFSLADKFLREGLCFWIILATLLLQIVKTGKHAFLVVYAPVTLLWLTIMISTPVASSMRYVLAFVYGLPVFIGLMFVRPEVSRDREDSDEMEGINYG